jgi:NADH-quinone oxidoreductase subunit J
VVEAAILACALTAAVASVGVVLSRDLLRAALGLLVVMLALAGIYAGAGAMLIAAIQVIVGAGAVVVLFMFAIMVLDSRHEGKPAFRMGKPFLSSAGVAALVIFSAAFAAAGFLDLVPGRMPGITAVVGSLFSANMLLLEATGLLLFVALVAVVILARKDPGR